MKEMKMSMTKGTPASSQIITLERLLEEANTENERLRAENAELRADAEFLFMLLDSIDTADDIAKADEKLYRALVRKEHKRRFEIASTDGYSVQWDSSNSSLRADAERYRWLRDSDSLCCPGVDLSNALHQAREQSDDDMCDAAIDAAMKEQK